MVAQQREDQTSLGTIPANISRQLTQRILAGDLKPGEKLIERELGEQYNAGRSSVRSALQELRFKHLVEPIRGRGWKVVDAPLSSSQSPMSPLTTNPVDRTPENVDQYSDIEFSLELLEVRMSLEPTAAGLAAVRRTNSEMREIGRLSKVYKQIDTSNVSGLISADEDFHRAIILAARNPTLLRLYEEQVTPKLRNFRRKSYTDANPKEKSDRDHDMIVNAVDLGDSSLARRTTLLHLWTLYEDVKSYGTLSRRRESIGIFG